MFPVFDQPDLKATWQFQASVPEDWIVCSNEKANENEFDGHTHDSLLQVLKPVASAFG